MASDNSVAHSGRNRRFALIAGIVVLVLVAVAALWWLFTRAGTTKITAYFDSSVGIYEGTDVRILGVVAGSVTKVEPIGDQVRVELRVDRGIDIPAEAKAVQIVPSIVADRYVQLTPAYTGGPKLESDSTIPIERTATPVEVDELYKSIEEVSNALGPDGANKDGALDQLVGTLAQNLQGNGEALGATISELSGAARTLSDYRGDLFDTVKNLQVFVTALAQNDQQVRNFNAQLSDLSSFLAGERQNLGAALEQLSWALGDVARFVRDNRDLIASNADGLVQVTQTLADNRQALVDSITTLPLALSNVVNAYDAESGTLASRLGLPDETQDPFGVVCRLIDLGKLVPGDPEFEALGRQMQPIIDNCKTITDQITAGVKTPSLVLPFGILSGDNIQRPATPGTVPGNVSPRFEDFGAPGVVPGNGGGQ